MAISQEKLVCFRKERGWSQEKLAAMSGVSVRTIQRAERDGTCSLETQMALATAFEISPSELVTQETPEPGDIQYRTSWGGAVGLLILGLAAPLVAILTAQNGQWELISFLVVIGFTLALSLTNYGAKATHRLFDNTSWLIRYPTHVNGLSGYIVHAKSIIEYAYIVGIVSSLVSWLALKTHHLSDIDNDTGLLLLAIRPLIYTVLFVELWFRPYKKKLELMLVQQSHKA